MRSSQWRLNVCSNRDGWIESTEGAASRHCRICNVTVFQYCTALHCTAQHYFGSQVHLSEPCYAKVIEIVIVIALATAALGYAVLYFHFGRAIASLTRVEVGALAVDVQVPQRGPRCTALAPYVRCRVTVRRVRCTNSHC